MTGLNEQLVGGWAPATKDGLDQKVLWRLTKMCVSVCVTLLFLKKIFED